MSERLDNRCGTRIPCDLRVLVMVPPAIFGPGVLLNVSVGGALLQTPLALDPLTQIELEVQGPGMGRSSILASITRRDVQEYGVVFRGNNSSVVQKMLSLARVLNPPAPRAATVEPRRVAQGRTELIPPPRFLS